MEKRKKRRKQRMSREEVENVLPYLKKKTSNLDSKLKDRDLTNEKDISGIVEGIIDSLHEIDDYLPTGINNTVEAIEQHGLDPKNILNLLIPLVNVFNYWKYLMKKYYRKQTDILKKHLPDHETLKQELAKLEKPKHTDLIPLAVLSVASAYAKPPYGSLAGAILSQFTIIK